MARISKNRIRSQKWIQQETTRSTDDLSVTRDPLLSPKAHVRYIVYEPIIHIHPT